jgi:hypothetical protein
MDNLSRSQPLDNVVRPKGKKTQLGPCCIFAFHWTAVALFRGRMFRGMPSRCLRRCYRGVAGRLSGQAERVFQGLFGSAVLAVVLLSLLPGSAVPAIGVNDKLEHVAAYAILAALGSSGFPRFSSGMVVAMLLLMLGIGLEVCQSFIPGRSADIFDIIADAGGISAGFVLKLLALYVAAGAKVARAARGLPAPLARPE